MGTMRAGAAVLVLGLLGTLCVRAWATSPPLADANAAIEALRAIEAVTVVGTSFEGYRQRVIDSKATVDHYLHGAPAGQLRDAVDVTMRYYVVAVAAWDLTLRRDAIEPMSEEDEALQRQRLDLDQAATACVSLRRLQSDKQAVAHLVKVPLFWGCAVRHLDEADRLAGRPRAIG